MLWFPLIYFCVKGIDICIAKRKSLKIIFYATFTLLTTFFFFNYTTIISRAFPQGIDKAVAITSSPNIDTVYFSETVKYPTILFYDPISPYVFDETKVEEDKDAEMIYITKFGKYNIGMPPIIEPKPKTAYVIHNAYIVKYNIDYSQFNVAKNGDFTILWNDLP